MEGAERCESLGRESKQEQARPRTFRLNMDAQLGPSLDRAEPRPFDSQPVLLFRANNMMETRRNKRER